MLVIQFNRDSNVHRILSNQSIDFNILTESPEEKVKLLIVRDLLRLGWEMDFKSNHVLIKPPALYDKKIIRDTMQIKRNELFATHSDWIGKHIELIQQNLADGVSVWKSKIYPVIEICETQKQFDIFRIFRFYWSSPYSEYVGRRIKLLIRDYALPNKPLIGIAALGSSIIHIPDRDTFIGWDKETRTKNLVYAMDAYVLGALPPYNYLLGGKLISYILASNEVRDIYRRKYRDKVTNISKRTANKLACIFTTSLYGRSSQYNRIKYNDKLLYIPIGQTKGYGTLHLTNETFAAMRGLIKSHNISVPNAFGDGPIWSMRIMRTAAEILGFDADFLLRHSFQRGIFLVPLAHNFKEFLRGEHTKLRHCDYPLNELVAYWKDRWLSIRRMNFEVKKSVLSFQADKFRIV
ncbi:MAG: DUF4338 domain-containing protein [Deltaproteobacteria bacterium]